MNGNNETKQLHNYTTAFQVLLQPKYTRLMIRMQPVQVNAKCARYVQPRAVYF
jgi:hypothetical protein